MKIWMVFVNGFKYTWAWGGFIFIITVQQRCLKSNMLSEGEKNIDVCAKKNKKQKKTWLIPWSREYTNHHTVYHKPDFMTLYCYLWVIPMPIIWYGVKLCWPKRKNNNIMKKMCLEKYFFLFLQTLWKHSSWSRNVNLKRPGRIMWQPSSESLVTSLVRTSGQTTKKGGKLWLTMNNHIPILGIYGKLTNFYRWMHKLILPALHHTITSPLFEV